VQNTPRPCFGYRQRTARLPPSFPLSDVHDFFLPEPPPPPFFLPWVPAYPLNHLPRLSNDRVGKTVCSTFSHPLPLFAVTLCGCQRRPAIRGFHFRHTFCCTPTRRLVLFPRAPPPVLFSMNLEPPYYPLKSFRNSCSCHSCLRSLLFDYPPVLPATPPIPPLFSLSFLSRFALPQAAPANRATSEVTNFLFPPPLVSTDFVGLWIFSS